MADIPSSTSSEPPAEPPAATPAQDEPSPLAGRVAASVVIFALGALVVLPILDQRASDEVRGEIFALMEPARTLNDRLRHALVRERIALLDFARTGDSVHLLGYRAAADSARDLIVFLESVTEPLELDPDPLPDLRRHVAEWHEVVEREGALAASGSVTSRSLHDSALAATDGVDRAVSEATQQGSFALRSQERRTLLITGLVVSLGLLAAVVVAWLGRNLRRMTRRAHRRGATLERLMREKERLVRGLTHEIKNNLGSIQGYAELLEMRLAGPLTEEQTDYASGIRASAERATGVIEDLVRTARGGKLHLRTGPTDLGEVVRSTTRDQIGTLRAAGLEIVYDIPPGPWRVHTDARKVSDILQNLLTNAARYASSGERVQVRIRAREEDDDENDAGWICVEVEDEGPGIPLEDQERIFEEFKRIHPDRGPGTGIGLFHSRNLARRLGGDLTVRSDRAKGSVFRLWLPVGDGAAVEKASGVSSEETAT